MIEGERIDGMVVWWYGGIYREIERDRQSVLIAYLFFYCVLFSCIYWFQPLVKKLHANFIF